MTSCEIIVSINLVSLVLQRKRHYVTIACFIVARSVCAVLIFLHIISQLYC